MYQSFNSYVIFAEMRTGSNFLEANLNTLDGVSCLGEAFNPHFIGYPNREETLGLSLAERNARPQRLLELVRNTPGTLSGFRFFHDHEPRVLDEILQDPKCAKIILTRNPADSYVSWKIAQSTNQWKLTNVAKRKDAIAQFNAPEFEEHLSKLQAFQVKLLNSLQKSGQTAFYVAYEDLLDVEIMNGLAKWLGIPARLDDLTNSLKRQNPSHISEKVQNFDEMERALARIDTFNLTRTPNFEPRRGPGIPTYIAAPTTPLLYKPIRSTAEDTVTAWLAALDGVKVNGLVVDFGHKTLRQWKRNNEGHRCFTVISHPLTRAHHAFCTKLLSHERGSFSGIRRTLKRAHGIELPENLDEAGYDLAKHRETFAAFLKFLKLNLQEQTAVRVDSHWASQSQTLLGFADFALPDMVLREDEMADQLPALAKTVGHNAPPPVVLQHSDNLPFELSDIYDAELEALARDAYQRDYMMFGFRNWSSLSTDAVPSQTETAHVS